MCALLPCSTTPHNSWCALPPLQVVLEVIETNVRRGSQVYEEGHVSWCRGWAGPAHTTLLMRVCMLCLACNARVRTKRSWVHFIQAVVAAVEGERGSFRQSILHANALVCAAPAHRCLMRTPQIVVLAWCESARDLGLVKRVLTQICAANRAKGKGTVVVLAQVRWRW